MGSNVNEAVIQLARALSDPTRLRIAALLIESELTLDQIATELGLRPADISRHLDLLRGSSLVIEQTEDGVTRFTLDLNELRRISRAAFARNRPESPEVEGDAWEQKVLRDFVKDGRLTSIPSTHKKRLVVLHWLAEQIPGDTRIPEREMNSYLERYHPDFATLRREMVDNGLMHRERGVYWRTESGTSLTS